MSPARRPSVAFTPDKVVKTFPLFDSDHGLTGIFNEAVFAAVAFRRAIPNIIAYRNVAVTADACIITMERGTLTLHRLAASSCFSDRCNSIVWIVQDIVNALHHLHCAGIVHCDIKPDNVVIMTDADTGEERAVLIDFGNSRFNKRGAGRHNEVLCTFGFCAPEALQQSCGPTPACDAYSLGALIYGYIFGSPFVHTQEGDTRRIVAKRLRRLQEDLTDGDAQWPSMKGVPPRMVDIMKGLLHPDPMQRLTIEELYRELVEPHCCCSVTAVIYNIPPVPEGHRDDFNRHIDLIHEICCIDNRTLEPAFALAVDISLRLAAATHWPVSELDVTACIALAHAVLTPDDLHCHPCAKHRRAMADVCTRLHFRLYADTSDWLLQSRYGVRTVDHTLLCKVLKATGGKTVDAVMQYRWQSMAANPRSLSVTSGPFGGVC